MGTAKKKVAASSSRSLRAISRVTSKGQATIPARVRAKLNIKPGDSVMFEESKAGAVYLRKAEPLDVEFLSALQGTLSEWNSENDEKAFGDL
jgi:antitoxin PrlF